MKKLITNFIVINTLCTIQLVFLYSLETKQSLLENIKKSGQILAQQDLSNKLNEQIQKQFNLVSKQIEDYVLANSKNNEKITSAYKTIKKAKNQLLIKREEIFKALKTNTNKNSSKLLLDLQNLIDETNTIIKSKNLASEALNQDNKNALQIIQEMAKGVKAAATETKKQFLSKIRD